MSTSAKVTARQRIENLLDDNSFVEIGAYVKARNTDFNIQAKDTPSDGVITGYGVINGGLVYVYSQDASVLGGSVGEMHAKKIASLYDMAMKTGSPVICRRLKCFRTDLYEAVTCIRSNPNSYSYFR